jgi:hypothetical protein
VTAPQERKQMLQTVKHLIKAFRGTPTKLREVPSEKFLIFHRTITAIDEWLFYALLLFLYLNGHTSIMWIVAPLGTLFIVISYAKMWYMEAMRFEMGKDENNG